MLLLEKRGELTQLDVTGRTVLHWAAGTANAALCNFLLGRGADPNCRDAIAGTW